MAQTTEQTTEAIDITELDELRGLIEQVQSGGVPRVLLVDGEEAAILTPIPQDEERKRARAAANLAAFRSAAGGWRGLVDGEKLKRELKEARGHGQPPDVRSEWRTSSIQIG